MGRRRKNEVEYDEFISPAERMEHDMSTGDFFTDYTTEQRVQHTVPLPVPTGVQPIIQPPPGAVNSPTPRLDWVLPKALSDVQYIDGDHELAEMDECELEALGLGHLRKANSRGEAPQKKMKTQSVKYFINTTLIPPDWVRRHTQFTFGHHTSTPTLPNY